MRLRALWYPFRLLKERYFGAATRNPLAAKHRLAKLSPQLPAEISAIAEIAVGELIEYQDSDYALLYLDRIDRFVGPGSIPPEFLTGIARHLSDLMQFDDPISDARLAQANLNRSPIKSSGPDTRVTYLASDMIGMLPISAAVYAMTILDRMKWLDKKVTIRFGRSNFFSRQLTKIFSSGRPTRTYSLRSAKQRALVERWLHMIDRSYSKQPAILQDTIESASLIRGRGQAYRLGLSNWNCIIDQLVKPACDGHHQEEALVAMVGQARSEAMADPTGQRLRRLIANASVGATARLA